MNIDELLELEESRVCSRCGERFALSEFRLITNKYKRADGTIAIYKRYGGYCRKDRAAYDKAWAKNNPEKVYINTTRWVKKNPEKVSLRGKRYSKKNPEKVSLRHKAWRENNPEKYREAYRSYKKENPEKIKLQNKRRIDELTPGYLNSLWKARFKDTITPELTPELLEQFKSLVLYGRELTKLKKQFNQKENGNNN